jgi:hypothetical protein
MTTLTEERFVLILNEFKKDILQDISLLKTDISQLKKDVSQLKTDMIEVKGFQNHEAQGIEFELYTILKKYLIETYQNMTVDDFPMKVINDPFGKIDIHGHLQQEDITQLDAAFLLKPYTRKFNYKRLKNLSLPIPTKNPQINMPYIFIMAEAKHFINSDKIKLKLWQFDRICNLFVLAKRINNTPNELKTPEHFGVHPKFISTIQRNNYLANIDESYLFFGAAYWEKTLLNSFESDVNKRNKLINEFYIQDNDKKIKIYHQICEIENKWYKMNYAPNKSNLSNDEILKIKKIEGAMNYVKFIQPSGERYRIVKENEPEPIRYSIYGGKTMKIPKKKCLNNNM